MTLKFSHLLRVSIVKYYKYFKKKSFPMNSKSNIKIDIIIPSIKKDLITLEHLLSSIYKFLNHNIGTIYVISPIDDAIISLTKKYNCVFINENDVPVTKKSDINYFYKNIDRSGWMFQQFIKFSADTISKEKFIYIIDSDTILTSSQIFHTGTKSILLCSDEFHEPYLETFEKVFGYKVKSKISFVSHQMLLDRSRLIEMKTEIEKRHNKRWDTAILSCLDKTQISSFSEYVVYANWMLIHYPNEISVEYFFNQSYKDLNNIQVILNKPMINIRSCSFHSYNLISY